MNGPGNRVLRPTCSTKPVVIAREVSLAAFDDLVGAHGPRLCGVELTPVTSSNLAAVGYDPSTGQLQIRFRNGREYVYQVPFSIYQGLMAASSKGRYFSFWIRWRYRGRRIR